MQVQAVYIACILQAQLEEGTVLTAQEVARPMRQLRDALGCSGTLARHNQAGDCWTIFQSRVYDVRAMALQSREVVLVWSAHMAQISAYVDFHPGGKKQIMQGAAS